MQIKAKLETLVSLEPRESTILHDVAQAIANRGAIDTVHDAEEVQKTCKSFAKALERMNQLHDMVEDAAARDVDDGYDVVASVHYPKAAAKATKAR